MLRSAEAFTLGTSRNMTRAKGAITECPSRERLASMLDDADPESDREQIEAHLGDCAHCQEALSQLAIDPEEWDRLVNVLQRNPETNAHDSGSPTVSTRLEIPGYEILEELGRGGAGVIYRARDKKLRRHVALKVLLSLDPEHAVRFHNEAEASARLQHPNIIEVFATGVQNDRMYLVMELIEGGDLARRLMGEPLRAAQAAELVETLGRAIHFAHQAGILHRDLKPANILLGKEGMRLDAGGGRQEERSSGLTSPAPSLQPKITDFGLAFWTATGGGPTLTGELIGTPSYMPPEQARAETGWATPQADIYALGAILYECLVGAPPFRAETTTATIQQLVSREPLPPRRLNPNIPSDLETICLKCLTKAPTQRYASADELADDLRRFLNHEPIHARPPSTWQRLAMWTRRHPAVAAFSATAALAACVLLTASAWFTVAVQHERRETARQTEEATSNYLLAKEAVAAILEIGTADFDELGTVSPSQQRVLEKARPLFVQFTKVKSDDLELLVQQADALQQLTLIEMRIDLQPDSLNTANEAIALFRELLRKQPKNADHLEDLITCTSMKGSIARNLSRYDEAIAAYDEAIRLTEVSIPGNANEVVDFARVHAACFFGRAWCHLIRKDAALAIADYERSRDVYYQLLNQTPDDPSLWRRVGMVTYQCGLAHSRSRNRKQADSLLAISLVERERALALEPGNSHFKWSVAISLAAIARGEIARGETESASERLERALQLVSEAATGDPHRHRLHKWQGVIHTRLGELAVVSHDDEAAEREFLAAMEIHEDLAWKFPHINDYVDDYLDACVDLRDLYENQNFTAKANNLYERGLAIQREVNKSMDATPIALGRLAISHAYFAAALHVKQANTQLSHRDSPPCARGTTWSIVSSSPPGWRPQYWHV